MRRRLDPDLAMTPGRDIDCAPLRETHRDADVPVAWLESNAPSHLLCTSGTTGKPKGVRRDVGGYALALSMRTVFDVGPGQVMFPSSDVGCRVRVINEVTGGETGPDESGVLVIQPPLPPLPPGCLTTIWGDDARVRGERVAEDALGQAGATFAAGADAADGSRRRVHP